MAWSLVTASLAGCGGSTATVPETPPGIGGVVQLKQVDGTSVPTIIASSGTDQFQVISGKATLGEAIATGPYSLLLRHSTGTTADTSTVTGITYLTVNGSIVSATIDLGAGLGTHAFSFSF